MSPKIQAATIVEQRAMRQRQLIDAALAIALESGAANITVAAVAQRAGLARSSIYEYFSSSADLIADLVIEELALYQKRLSHAVIGTQDPYQHIELWIAEALQYVVDGRHMLVKSLNAATIPEFRRDEISQGHRNLMTTISAPLQEIGLTDIRGAMSYLQNTIEAASVRIESGSDAEIEIQSAQIYAIAGLRALALEINANVQKR
ncbi:transcriptional regulator [Candidatus Planktophila versatilis]|jgi:AcrR family transcriptional regulator|uniref:TetR/AcrR family transcriptional regulator n=1 Tax=Candidatus Planktophila versatilis TaxID=1884905 RepID=UPI000BACB95E|nr:TetR/AcrR family transcriptional regulator [Candidatus Planktophila versatilis]ASY18670.1 transcriptional regulator [Candidatus Planktophila versatilis]